MAVEMTKTEVVLGRHSSSDVRLALPDVSRRHCRFIFVDASWYVIDLNSLNGTFVNGQRIQQIALRHRDRLRIGGFTFEVSLNQMPGTVVFPPNPIQEKRRAS
jgi:pSer/pThr/pTyr-binding forkhead associated (FHA) protein